MSNSLKALILALGIIITLGVGRMGNYVYSEASTTTNNAMSEISRMNKELMEIDKTMYDGLDVSGSEVINSINKYKNQDLSIKVITKKSTVYYNRYLTDTDKELGEISTVPIKDAQRITNVNYINQYAKFTGEILRDVNDTIIGIKFTQR